MIFCDFDDFFTCFDDFWMIFCDFDDFFTCFDDFWMIFGIFSKNKVLHPNRVVCKTFLCL